MEAYRGRRKARQDMERAWLSGRYMHVSRKTKLEKTDYGMRGVMEAKGRTMKKPEGK